MCALFVIAIGAGAQGYQRTPFAHRVEEGQRLFDEYRAGLRGKGMAARVHLDGVSVHGIAQTPENVRSVRELLASRVTAEEKVALVRILGRLYTQNDATGMNAAIVRDLKGFANAGEKDVAGAAVLAFSRLGYFPDSSEVLLQAKNRGVIDGDGYYGELAHLFAVAPADAQNGLMRRIREGKNAYALEILVSCCRFPSQTARMSPETRSTLLGALEENEPGFPMALGEFGMIEAMRYADWLQAVALLGSHGDKAKYNQLVLARLGDARLDPRKAMAFLASAQGKDLIRDVGRKNAFSAILERVELYSRQLPQNALMKEMSLEARRSVDALR